MDNYIENLPSTDNYIKDLIEYDKKFPDFGKLSNFPLYPYNNLNKHFNKQLIWYMRNQLYRTKKEDICKMIQMTLRHWSLNFYFQYQVLDLFL